MSLGEGSCSLFAVLGLLVVVLGCGEESGSGVVEPLADEPMILEAVTCLDVDDARPVGITDSFLESDDRIYIWIYWSNIESASTVKVVWFEPGESLATREDSRTVNPSTGFVITWFSIERPEDGFAKGEWSVDIYLNGMFERSHLFIVE